MLGRVVNLGKAQSVGKRQGLLVHTGSTYYIYIFVGRAVAYCLLKRAVGVAAGEAALCATESLKVVGQPIQQFVFEADGAVGGNGGNYCYHIPNS